MADLFRKSSLEKLSSPEQLDKMIVITSPSFWLAMLGAAFIVATALVWSIFGRLPENVDTQGIYVNRAGIQSVYCEGSGTVAEIKVQDGDTVKKGDIIAVLDTSDIDEKIVEYEEKKAAVESVSEDGTAISSKIRDNKDVLALYNDLYQSVEMLKYQTEQLDQKRATLAATEQKYLDIEAKYYESFNVGDSTEAQVDYSDKQSTYSSAVQYADQAKSSYIQARSSYLQAKAAYNTAKRAVDNGNMPPEQLMEYEAAMDSARAAMDEAEELYDDYDEERIDEEREYEQAKGLYIAKNEAVNKAQAQQSELGNRYNVISQQYNSEKSAVENLEDNISQTKIQINVTKTYILSSLKSEYKDYLDQKEVSEIKAITDGRVSDLAVSAGSIIGQGTEIAKIQKGEDSDRVVVCYVPVSEGRKVKAGMKVLIYPSTVNKQEYGHMEATVVNVDDYITSTTDMQRQLGDSNLVESFMQNGPVVEVRCELKTDPNTVSGYYWSSNKGTSVNVDGGTMMEASIVISEKPPISLLIPFLKEKLTIKADK